MISAPSSSTGSKRHATSACARKLLGRHTARLLLARWLGAILGGCGLVSAISLATAMPARADLQVCNGTTSRVGVAVGYKDAEGNWATEGWWNLPPHVCESLLKGTLGARYYYVYAIDYDNGGEWAGPAFMCTREKEFRIIGIEDCLARGYDRTGFREIDTAQQRSWTVQLTEAQQQNPPQPSMPMLPIAPGRQAPPPAATPGSQNR